MSGLIAEDHQIVITFDDAELGTRDAREWFEGRTSRPPAVRAVAIRGVDEFIRHCVLDRPAQALSGKLAAACLSFAGLSQASPSRWIAAGVEQAAMGFPP
jgi:hypothetical protein